MKNRYIHTTTISKLTTAFVLSVLLLCQLLLCQPNISIAEIKNPKSYELNEKASAAAQAGDLKKAEKLLDRALEVDPGNISAAFNLASIYLQRDRAGEAAELLTKYTERHKKDAGLFARLGDAQFAAKDIHNASASYEKALKLDKNYPKISARLGTIYSIRRETKKAIGFYLKAVEQEPKNPQYLANLSSLFLADKQPSKAVGVAKRALQVRANSDVYITLGTAYEDMKDYKNSLIAFKRALDLGGNRKKIKAKIEQIEDLSEEMNG